MRSFKYKLVGYFVLVALLPVAGAFYGLDALSQRHATQRIDNRLRGDLRSVVVGYRAQLDGAERRALQVPVAIAVERLGPAIDPHDTLVGMRGGVIQTGRYRGRPLPLTPGNPTRVTLDGRTYRGLSTATLDGDLQFVSLVPETELSGAISAARWEIVVGLSLGLAVLALIAYAIGLSIVRALARFARAADEIARGRFEERIPVSGSDEFAQVGEAFNRMAAQLEQRLVELEQERRRTREVTARFGKALTATHDVELLLRVIIETMVEATGADGGLVLGHYGELARAGDPDSGVQRLELSLTVGGEPYGKVTLTGISFDEAQVETASSLAAQASVALDNARLHHIVEWQALVDALTGLSNRRALEESLEEEITRAQRFGGDVCLVLADLDRFKAINDEFGHLSGDHVLRVFAQTLREVVRDVDTAGRWGGEEFALILPGTAAAGGVAAAERVRTTLATREIRSTAGRPITLTASFGVAALSSSGDLQTLVADADDALYWAKHEGRDRVASAIDTIRR
jgi:diguanylate cyclase (GGDEF)-like protein